MKIYLVHNNQRIAKKKTHIKKRSLNPVFNESFVFDLPNRDGGLASSQLEFVMLDWDRVTKNEVPRSGLVSPYFSQFQVIGRLTLGGPECSGTALRHWEEIQASPRRQIAQWHKLKG